MKPGNPLLAALWQADREKAKAQIETAMRTANGNVRVAAEALGLHYRTLYRWIKEEWGDMSSVCPDGLHQLGEGENCRNCERWKLATASTIPPAPNEDKDAAR